MSEGTAGMWANMLGLGPLLGAINDPNFQHQIKVIVASITSTSEATARIEAKLDLILSRDPSYGRKRLAPIPYDNGSAGAGTNSVAGGAPDDGSGETEERPDRSHAVGQARLHLR
jgi:hypothetical protein